MQFDKEDLIILRQEIDKYKDIALSDQDIRSLLDGKCSIVLYRDMHKISTIDQLLGKYNSCVVLIETKEKYGHWVCITLRNDKHKGKHILEYFDALGKPPDYWLDDISPMFARETNQDKPYLSQLLIDCPYKLSYNEFDFQELGNGSVKTCGRWVCLRIMFRDETLKTFKDIFYDVFSDELATYFTMDKSQLKKGRVQEVK